MTSQSTSTLRSRYVEQAASDLEENRRRQQELADTLEVLKQEEALLSDIMRLAERYEGPSDPSRPPESAQEKPAPVQAGRGAGNTSRKGPAAGATAKNAVRGKSRAKTAAKGKSRQPLLGDVLLDLLRTHDEPRLAKELRDELLEKHPDRTPTPQVVRNTLESLVAKGRIRRHKQQRSVMYTPVEPSQKGSGASAGDS
ncbi:BlaI/MecI/CopY family transcriptional regulator [Streptomyces sp. NPDC007088]|uniref:BlaI/MecI/CopY family transcriptional regulator n=1 Tax=Streptomyces sp. NPDC007088 TaxID=3364773 RepID=UPI0036777C9C